MTNYRKYFFKIIFIMTFQFSKNLLVSFLAVFYLASGCNADISDDDDFGNDRSTSDVFGKGDVYGEDDREIVSLYEPNNHFPTDKDLPAVGSFLTGCTATLVSDRLILTARHCIFNQDGHIRDNLIFRPYVLEKDWSGHLRRPWYQITNIWKDDSVILSGEHPQTGIKGKIFPSEYKYDWAFLSLDRSTGLNPIHIANYSIDTMIEGLYITNAGYPIDTGDVDVLNIHRDCTIRKLVPEYTCFYHDCDGTYGSSGSPILRRTPSQYFIIGLFMSHKVNISGEYHFQEYTDDYPNIAIPSSLFFSTYQNLIDQGY